MGVGWNVGNSLDAVGGETAWGNPKITQTLIDSVKAAGFKSIRLPVAWSQFSDANAFVISKDWINRVEEVIKYCQNADMIVMINMHWDGGWMQPTYAQQDYVNKRMATMWKQIATHFRDYDDRLVFAGTNEVMVSGDYGTPTEEYYTVQNGFNKIFVDTVRATGGKNAYRQLVVQGFNTNIGHTVNFAVMPKDVVPKRLAMEVHFYDPWQFTGEEGNDDAYQWGRIATDSNATSGWGNEDWVDSQFQRMKSNFVDKGIGVILGEYGAVSRESKDPSGTYRIYWNKYVTGSAVDHSLVPMYWDNGYSGNHGFGLFDRNTGAQIYEGVVSAIVSADD